MTKKSFIIILGISVVIWYLSRIAQALLELLVFKTSSISIYPSAKSETGYPFSLYINSSDATFYIYSFLNVAFWFIVIFIIWKFIRKILKK